MKKTLLLSILFFTITFFSFGQTITKTFVTATNPKTFTVPAGVVLVTAECWGGGGAGGGSTNAGSGVARGGAGGGGGAYAKSSFTVAPTNVLTAVVGTGGAAANGATGAAGGNSTITSPSITNLSTIIYAAGGSGGTGNTSGNTPARGTGGTTGNAGNITVTTGGNGGPGATGLGIDSGFGGAGAGPTGGAGGDPIEDQGNTASGDAGSTFGGGGGGSRTSQNGGPKIGGAGAAGKVVITYTCPTSAGTLSGNQYLCTYSPASTTFSSTIPGGTWSTTNSSIAAVNSVTGVITSPAGANGSATITYTIPATADCPVQNATRIVYATNSQPTTPNTPTGSSPVCQSSTATYTTNSIPNVTYNWVYTGSGATITPAADGLSASVVYGSAATSGRVEVSTTNGCGTSGATGINISVSQTSNGGTITASATSGCQGQSYITRLELSGYIGLPIRWESSTDNFGSNIVSIANTNNGMNIGNISQTTSYRAVVQNSPCTTPAYSNIFTITIGSSSYTVTSASSSTPADVCINTAIPTITHTTTGATSIGTPSGLPTGVTASFASNKITITGTPTAAGTFNYSIPLSGGCGTAASATGTITVRTNTATASSNPTTCISTAMPSITHTTTGATGISNSGVIGANGLPAGVSASWVSNTITISGTPSVAGTFNYSIPLTGGCGTVNATGTITVSANKTVTVASSNPTTCISTPITTITHTTTGGATGISNNGVSGANGLPAGVSASWASNTITISGTPSVAGTFNYSIPVIGCGPSINAIGTITVNANNTVTTASSNPIVCINTAITAVTITTTGVTGISNNGISGANGLPAGVSASWASNTITITGTPSVAGTFNYSIPLTGGCGSINATGTITVNANNTVTTASSNPNVCINTAITAVTITTTRATGISNNGVSGANGLPAGVSASWASNTITITGIPSVAGTFNYSIPLAGGCGSVNATGTITVNANNTVTTSSSNPSICINTAITAVTITTTGATGISNNGTSGANGLPAGVSASWASNTITITGTPTVAGTFNYSIPLTGGCGSVNAIGTITVNANNTVTAASSNPTACINTAITAVTITTTGATGISNNGTSGANGLPAGVSASWASNTITITGIPSVAGTFNYSIPLTGGCGSVNAIGTITVNPDNTVTTASSNPNVCINTAITAVTITTTRATGISNNGVSGANGLPAGVSASWASNTITISGTPSVAGTFNYSIALTGGCGSVNATGTITVNANNTVTTASSNPSTCINTAITAVTITTTGATGISNNGTSGANGLPAGVSASWASNTITITGTPSVAGTFNYSIPLTGGCGSVNAVGTITVNANNTVTTASSNPNVCINTAITAVTITTTRATGISNNGVSGANGLPAGVSASWASNTITISGTPSVSGTFNYSIPLTGGCGSVNAIGTINANPVLPVSVSIVSDQSGTSVCQGTTVKFTATPTNGGTPSQYQWYNGSTIINGQTAATYSTNQLTSTDVIKVVITSTATCSAGTQATSNSLSYTVLTTDRGVTQGGKHICQGTATPLLKLVNSGPGNVPYSDPTKVLYWEYSDNGNVTWTKITGTAGIIQYQPTDILTANRTYRAQVQTPGCPLGNAAIETGIDVEPLPVVTFTTKPGTNSCIGTNVTYTTETGKSNYIWTVQGTLNTDYKIITGNLSTSSATVTLQWLTTGSKTVTVNYSNGNPYNCTATTPTSSTTTVNPAPAAPIVGTIVQPTCALPTGSVTLSSLPNSGLLLYLADNSTTATYNITGATMTISGLSPGKYKFAIDNPCGTIYSTEVVISANKWNGTTWSNGNAEPTENDVLVFESDYSLNKDIKGCSCTVTNGANVTIQQGKTMTITDFVHVDSGSLTFENNASLVQINNVTNIGNINYKRDTAPVRRYDVTYWSTPVKSATYTLHDLSPSTLGDKYYTYDPTNGFIINYNGTSTMTPGVGYLVRAPQPYDIDTPAVYTAKFVGVPNNGDISVTPQNGKWNLIGNPYPSAIDADELIGNNSTGALYFWTHNTKPSSALPGDGKYNYTSADYAVYSLTGSVSTNGATSTTGYKAAPTGSIAAGQSFFMKASSANPIVFINHMRIPGENTQFFKTTKSSELEKNRLWINLTNAEGIFKQALVGYIEGATNSWDLNYDAATINGNEYADFYTINDALKLSVQGRALPFDNTDLVPLGYRTTIAGDFTISIDHADGFFNDQKVYLEDKTTGTVNDLTAGDYTFTTATGTFTDRFTLKYINKTLGTGDFENIDKSVLVSVKDKLIKVNSTQESIKEVMIYDITGKLLYNKKKVGNTELQITNLQSSNQVLVIKVTLENDYSTSKKIIFN